MEIVHSSALIPGISCFKIPLEKMPVHTLHTLWAPGHHGA
jgi:hypothetical protein